jgi:hypothetical protein
MLLLVMMMTIVVQLLLNADAQAADQIGGQVDQFPALSFSTSERYFSFAPKITGCLFDAVLPGSQR